MKTNQLLLLFFCFALTFTACLEDKAEVLYRFYSDEDYETLSQILDIPNEAVNFNNNNNNQFSFTPPVSNNAALLGRVLFYDHKLSKNEKVSCASCHLQEHGFADKVAFSEGFDGRLTERNSLSLSINISTYESQGIGFFWDERSNSIREQSIETIENPIEMGMKMDELVERLKHEEYYQILFTKAFPGQGINESTITSALTSFINSIATFDSKFDREFRQRHGNMNMPFEGFSDKENRGKSLYIKNCQSCHGNMMFQNKTTANNGLDLEYADQGVGERTNLMPHMGKFKVPSLRNVAISGPYMHDGRFDTLADVIDHYSEGIQNHPNLDEDLKEGNEAVKMNFSAEDKASLVAFLETLTDKTLMADERFSDPFLK